MGTVAARRVGRAYPRREVTDAGRTSRRVTQGRTVELEAPTTLDRAPAEGPGGDAHSSSPVRLRGGGAHDEPRCGTSAGIPDCRYRPSVPSRPPPVPSIPDEPQPRAR